MANITEDLTYIVTLIKEKLYYQNHLIHLISALKVGKRSPGRKEVFTNTD